MPRLIVASNRVPSSKGEIGAGGLATALSDALTSHGGIWFGWSGRTSDSPDEQAALDEHEGFTVATLDLPEDEFQGYYTGMSNAALWPAFHSRLDMVHVDHTAYSDYRSVNRRFASALHPLSRADDIIWVHDYQLIPLGQELRRRGVIGPIGFFLHIPFPPAEIFAALPWATQLAAQLTAYDLVGFQTVDCARNFAEFVARCVPDGSSDAGQVQIDGRRCRIGSFPIGIDTARFATLAESKVVAARARRMRDWLQGRTGIIGVERLDYSKGIAQRFLALEALFERAPALIEHLSLVQIAAPSRLKIAEYQDMQADLEALSGRINGRFSTLDWTPIRYLNRSFNHTQITGLYRACRVALVTPLRGGMNLVAKEYIAAQDPDDPGVLVLSRFAGAARELRDAVIVNPYDPRAMADAIVRAIDMPIDERRERWRRSMEHLRTHDVHRWSRDFLTALRSAHADRERSVAA